MLMIRSIVPLVPPSPFSGLANSIVWPFRNNPRDRSWLLIYKEAAFRFSDSIVTSKFAKCLHESGRV